MSVFVFVLGHSFFGCPFFTLKKIKKLYSHIVYLKNSCIFTSVKNKNKDKMTKFESHQTFENQELKVEINFFGLEKITEKEDNSSRVQNCNVTDSLKYWTKHFRSERQIILNGYPTIK